MSRTPHWRLTVTGPSLPRMKRSCVCSTAQPRPCCSLPSMCSDSVCTPTDSRLGSRIYGSGGRIYSHGSAVRSMRPPTRSSLNSCESFATSRRPVGTRMIRLRRPQNLRASSFRFNSSRVQGFSAFSVPRPSWNSDRHHPLRIGVGSLLSSRCRDGRGAASRKSQVPTIPVSPRRGIRLWDFTSEVIDSPPHRRFNSTAGEGDACPSTHSREPTRMNGGDDNALLGNR